MSDMKKQEDFNKIKVVGEGVCEMDSEYRIIWDVVKAKMESGEPVALQDFPSVRTQEIFIQEMSEGLANIISCMELKKEDSILEIHSGFGQGTTYLRKFTTDITCMEKSVLKSQINVMQNQDISAVYVGDEGDCLEKIDRKFQNIIVWELPGIDLESFFFGLKEHLAPGGRIYLCFTNKYSIFRLSKLEKSQEGTYAYMPDKHLYTKDIVMNLLHKTGFLHMDLYFPYPDYRYTMAMYSMDRLPGVGELNKNQFHFCSEDIRFADNLDALFDQIVEDGLFGQLANAYMLVVKGN